jgi:hypothetical protein
MSWESVTPMRIMLRGRLGIVCVHSGSRAPFVHIALYSGTNCPLIIVTYIKPCIFQKRLRINKIAFLNNALIV